MKIRPLTGKTKSFEQQQQRKHPTSQDKPSSPPSSTSSSLLFYWNRPIGAPSTLIRLTISERQCKQSNTLRQVHDTSSCSIQNIISCWALPITSIQQLMNEIRKSTNHNNNYYHHEKIDTLEICFNNATTSFLLLSKEKEKDDFIWKTIANELVNCCGNTIHTIQFIYHHHQQHSSSSSLSSSSTVSRSYNISTATSNGSKIPITSQCSNNEKDNVCIEQYIYHCTSIILHAFANYIKTIHFNFMVPYDINTTTSTNNISSSSSSDTISNTNDTSSTKVQSVKMKSIIGQQAQSKQSNGHSNHNRSSSSDLFYSKLWNCLQHCIKLQELCISNGPCIESFSYHDDFDTKLLLQNIILPRLYQLKLHNMYISKHVWDTYLLSCIEMNNIIPIFENITFVNNTCNSNDNNNNTNTVQLSDNYNKNNANIANRLGSNNDDISSSSSISNMKLSSCNTVQQKQQSTLSASLTNYNDMCDTNTKQQRTIVHKLIIDDHEYIQWLQLLHQWRYNMIEKYCPNSIIQQQQQQSFYSRQQIYTAYYSTKKSHFNNMNNSNHTGTTQHTIKTRKLIDTVVIIIRDWYKS